VSVTFKIAVTFAILASSGTVGGLSCQANAQTIGSSCISTTSSRGFACGKDEVKMVGAPTEPLELAKRD
jgi:hypothetical protein